MPRRSKITTLPPEIKAELDRRLVAGSFADYDGMAAWLNGQLAALGLELTVSRSAVHRYGQSVEERIARIKTSADIATVIVDEVGDDEGKINDSLLRMFQEKVFNALMSMQEIDGDSLDILKLGRVIAELTKASVSQKKWMAEVKKKTERALENIERKAPEMDKTELLKFVKEQVYGIS